MHTDSNPTLCQCGKPIIKPRRLFCSDKCNKKARQKRWRESHPEYRKTEIKMRVYMNRSLADDLDAWAVRNGQSRGQAAHKIIKEFLEKGAQS